MKEDWEVKKLKEVCDKITDGTHQTPKYFDEGVIFLSSKNVTSGKIDWENIKYIDEAQHIQMHKRVAPKVGDILLAKNGTTGVAAMVDRDVVFDIYVSLAHIRSLGEIIPEYMLYFINSPIAKSQFNKRLKGIGVPNLHLKEIREVEITYPKSIEEQKQIVAILDKAFTVIDQAQANIEKNIENAKELFDSKKAEYFERLTLKNELLPITETCEKIFAGGDKPKPNFSKTETDEFKIPVISNGEKNDGLFGYTDIAKVLKPAITVSARGTIGYTSYRDYPFVPIVRLIVLIPKTEIIDIEFLMYAIKNLEILRTGSSIPQLTVPMIKGYSIPLPSKEKQKEIVESLNQLEIQLEEYESALAKKLIELSNLKKSVLQKAFSGKLNKNTVAV